MEINGKVYRNLEGQVAYLTQYLETNALANEMGIKVLGRVDSVDDIPAGDYEYGDAYMIGEEGATPYRMVIWSRDAGDGNPGWFDIGYFPTAPDEFSIVEVNGSPVHVFNADTKLEKQTGETSERQVYAKGTNGTQTMIDVAQTVLAGAIPVRSSTGNILVPDTPNNDSFATSKKYTDTTFVHQDKTVTPYTKVYIKNPDGTQDTLSSDSTPTAAFIVRYAAQGQLNIPNQTTYPPSDDQAISKRFAGDNYLGKRYLHSIVIEYNLGTQYFYVMGHIVTNSSNAITTLGYATMRLMVTDYGVFEDGNLDYPAAVAKMPKDFPQDNYDSPLDGFLFTYHDGSQFVTTRVNTDTFLYTISDVVTEF